jgi:Ca2+/Na+ antiporter
MDKLINFINKEIVILVLVLIITYIVLYLLKIDLYSITTAIILIIYISYKYITDLKEKEVIVKKTKEVFKNELPTVIDKYDDIINFLYYISDFKQYNEQVYNDFIINLNDFFTVYDDYQILKPNKQKLMTDILLDTRKKILNDLSLFIYSFNNSPILRGKLDLSIEKLNIILNKYLNKLNIDINSVDAFNNY